MSVDDKSEVRRLCRPRTISLKKPSHWKCNKKVYVPLWEKYIYQIWNEHYTGKSTYIYIFCQIFGMYFPIKDFNTLADHIIWLFSELIQIRVFSGVWQDHVSSNSIQIWRTYQLRILNCKHSIQILYSFELFF